MAEFVLMNFIFIFVHLIAFASNDISCLQFLWSVHFPGFDPQAISKFSRLSGNCLDHLENIQAIQKLSGPSRNYPDYLETLQAIRKLSRLSEKYPDYLENIQPIRKLSRLSGNFPGYPEIFRIIRKISSLSGNYLKDPETSQCNFKGYAQKLSGRAKTFRVAMPPCHPGFCASALLMVTCSQDQK